MRKHLAILICFKFLIQNGLSQPWEKVGDFETYFPTFLFPDTTVSSLLFAGRFVEVNEQPVFGITELKNDSFHAFGCGIDWNCVTPYTTNGIYTNSIAKYNNDIYITGLFNLAGNNPCRSIAKWDGQNWHSLGSGLALGNILGFGNTLNVIDDELYLGGSFDSAFGISAHSLIKYDGQNWSTVYDIPEFSTIGSQNNFHKVVKFQDKIYVGGQFYRGFPNTTINALVMYNDSEWVKVGSGIPNPNDIVTNMVVYKDELIVAGQFSKNSHPQNPGNNIAAWNGSTWRTLGDASQNFGITGINSYVSGLLVHGDYLYVSGMFTEAGGKPATGIARWDGNNWCALATGFGYQPVISMAFYGDTLFVVGAFRDYSGDSTIRFAAKLPNPDNHVLNCTSVGIETLKKYKEQISIFPNPSNSSIRLEDLTTFSTIEILDPLGKLEIRLEKISSQEINIEHLQDGLHFIKVYSIRGELEGTGKFVKVK